MIKSLLNHPKVFDFFQNLVGRKNFLADYVQHRIRPVEGMRILDIGCGTADVLALMQGVDYVGFDVSKPYIEAARKHYGPKGSFHAEQLTEEHLKSLGRFDVVTFNGVLHHLNDGLAESLLGLAKAALKAEGRMVSIDPCLYQGQSWASAYLVKRDRGQFVRPREDYLKLVARYFAQVDSKLLEHPLRIPYSLLILEAKN
ncbi:MAG: class I SAM-dependent methyltransferase [bacterium]|nr:class I SAM-dependent methyltransferase [bacterium]